MHLSFQINHQSISKFIDYWSTQYADKEEKKYDDNIRNPLTEVSRRELFEWKNGSTISGKKLQSIEANYPLEFTDDTGDQKKRYLNHNECGGPIWNIFYLHCLAPDDWRIYDQHTFMAMRYIQKGTIEQISNNKEKIFESYTKEYSPFFQSMGGIEHRKLDKAFFAFGQFLKIANKYNKHV